MEIPNHLLRIDEVAQLLNVEPATVNDYENKGIIQRVPKLPSKRYNPKQIAELIGTDPEMFTAFQFKKIEKELEKERQENARLKKQLETIRSVIGGENE